MGLWSKTVSRSQTGELRQEEIYIPEGLLKDISGYSYTTNTSALAKMYKEKPRVRKLDMSRPQFIYWGKFMDRQLLEQNFVITDPSSEIYITGGTRSTNLKISRYDTNIITERYNTKCDFLQSIRNIGRTGSYNCVNLDEKEFMNLKHVVRYMSNYIKPKHWCEELFYEWLNK